MSALWPWLGVSKSEKAMEAGVALGRKQLESEVREALEYSSLLERGMTTVEVVRVLVTERSRLQADVVRLERELREAKESARDTFAAAMLPEVHRAVVSRSINGGSGVASREWMADYAYDLADAMMQRRKKVTP